MTEAHHIPNATPFDLITDNLSDLIEEARNWADGEPVSTQAQADDVSRLIEELNKNAKALDEARVEEKKPLDDQIKAIQDRFNLWIADRKNKKPGKVWLAVDALKAALQPFLLEQGRIKREAEEKLRREAEEAAAKAQEALRQAEASDLAAREAADALMEQAEAAQAEAKAASKDKAHAVGGSRAMGLRTRWVARVTDYRLAARHYWARDPDAFNAVIEKLAADDAREGRRSEVPGVEFVEERVL